LPNKANLLTFRSDLNTSNPVGGAVVTQKRITANAYMKFVYLNYYPTS